MRYKYLTVDGVPTNCRCFMANNYFLRLRGLIGRQFGDEFKALALVPCNQIHTYFMSYPIDVAYINKAGTVLQTDAALEKGKMCKAVRKARITVEMPVGALKEYDIAVGKTIAFSDKGDSQ